uniref:Uncharacterized protein n=1 Tax=Ditylenchus dipsaci TaxID=166011 RepID=A0A915DQM5_9BILA
MTGMGMAWKPRKKSKSLGAQKQAWYQSFTGNHVRKLLTGDGPHKIAQATGTAIFAIAGLTVSCFIFLTNLINLDPASCVLCLIVVAVFSCILMAIRFRKPELYMPFLVVNEFCIKILCCGIVILNAMSLIGVLTKTYEQQDFSKFL